MKTSNRFGTLGPVSEEQRLKNLRPVSEAEKRSMDMFIKENEQRDIQKRTQDAWDQINRTGIYASPNTPARQMSPAEQWLKSYKDQYNVNAMQKLVTPPTLVDDGYGNAISPDQLNIANIRNKKNNNTVDASIGKEKEDALIGKVKSFLNELGPYDPPSDPEKKTRKHILQELGAQWLAGKQGKEGVTGGSRFIEEAAAMGVHF